MADVGTSHDLGSDEGLGATAQTGREMIVPSYISGDMLHPWVGGRNGEVPAKFDDAAGRTLEAALMPVRSVQGQSTFRPALDAVGSRVPPEYSAVYQEVRQLLAGT